MNANAAYALSKGYTDETVIGGGALKGKNCTISSITEIEGGHRVTFSWTLDNGTTKSQTMDVMDGRTPEKDVDYFDGEKGDKGDKGEGIETITKTSTAGIVDTYTILFTDGSVTTYNVVNGANITKLSELENDENFVKATTIGLVNYFLKDETYSKSQIDEILRNVGAGLSVKIVATLPLTDISPTTIYLINTSGSNYNQYMNIDGSWANLGSTAVDMSSYYNKTQIDTKLEDYVTANRLTNKLDDYVEKDKLAKVGKSNSYNDLDDLPEIPDVSGLKPYVETLQDSVNTAPVSKVVYDAVQELNEAIENAGKIDDDAIATDSTWSSKKINASLVDINANLGELEGALDGKASKNDYEVTDLNELVVTDDNTIYRWVAKNGQAIKNAPTSSTGFWGFAHNVWGYTTQIAYSLEGIQYKRSSWTDGSGVHWNAWQELATMDKVGVNDDNPSITYNSSDVTITVNKIINGVWYISGYTMRDIRDTDVVTINGYKLAFDKIFYGVDQKTNYYRCWGNKLQTSNVANDSCFGFHLPVVRA